MSDYQPEDFSEENPLQSLGRINLSLDGSVFANVYADTDFSLEAGVKIDLSELQSRIGYEHPIDKYIDSLLTEYTGGGVDQDTRVYYGYEQMLSKVSSSKSFQAAIDSIEQEGEDAETAVYYVRVTDTK